MESDDRVEGARRPHSPLRRWAREITLALLLTIAAAAFITAAFLRGDGSPYSAPTYETARKPSAG
jgi:hypothetical protein